MNAKSKMFDSLTGLRGAGAVWVTLFHLFDQSPLSVVKSGYLGVDLFFILSGFIISHVHAPDFFSAYSRAAHSRFVKLRLARIYPLHVVILLLFAAFVFFAPGVAIRYPHPERLDFPHFLASLFLVHNWGIGPPPLWNGPTWSLSAEWLVYLLFPFISRFCTRTVPTNMVLPGAILALAVVELLLFVFGAGGGMGKSGLLRAAGEFVAGCLIYRHVVGASHPGQPALAWISLIMLAMSIYFHDVRWIAPFAFALLILSAASQPTIVSRFFSSRVLIFLGEISFSLYLCHWPLIQVRNWAVDRHYVGADAGLALVVPAICCATLLCWRCIEKPARQFARRLIHVDGVVA